MRWPRKTFIGQGEVSTLDLFLFSGKINFRGVIVSGDKLDVRRVDKVDDQATTGGSIIRTQECLQPIISLWKPAWHSAHLPVRRTKPNSSSFMLMGLIGLKSEPGAGSWKIWSMSFPIGEMWFMKQAPGPLCLWESVFGNLHFAFHNWVIKGYIMPPALVCTAISIGWGYRTNLLSSEMNIPFIGPCSRFLLYPLMIWSPRHWEKFMDQ